MTGNAVVQQPASWIITLTLTQQERDDLTALFYRFKDGQIATGLPPDVGARVNNLALPLYQVFDNGVTPPV